MEFLGIAGIPGGINILERSTAISVDAAAILMSLVEVGSPLVSEKTAIEPLLAS